MSRGTILALVAMAIGVFLVANDFTALSVALVDIENDFDTTLNRTQWVINAYTVVFGVLIVTGGRLADLLGRKRIFLTGGAIFAVFSFLGALAPSIEALIASRALMGIGGALMWPAVLGMTYAILPKDKAGLAGGLIIGVAGIGNAFGPLLGGFLTDALSWRWIFFVNVPITLLAMFVTRRYVKETRAEGKSRIDYRGIATLSAGVILALIGLDQGTESGFGDPGIIAMFCVSAILLVSFAFIERREGQTALVPNEMLRNRQFAAAALSTLMLSAVFFAVLVYLPQFMQNELGWSAIGAGAGLLPLMLAFAITSFLAGPLYNRLGAKIIVGTGAACLVAGIFLLSFLEAASGYTVLVPGMLVVGLGVGLYYSAITTAAVTVVEPTQTSLAGGIVYMCQVAGGSLGLGLNTAIVLSATSLTDGITLAFRVSAALGLLGLFIVLIFINGRHTKRKHHFRLHRAHG